MNEKRYFLFLSIALIINACTGNDMELSYEPGIYKPHKQDTLTVYAYTEGRMIDGSSIKPYEFMKKIGDFHFANMEEGSDQLGVAGIKWSSIHLEKKNKAYINCPTCINVPIQLEVLNDSLFLKPKDLSNILKFSPYSEIGLVQVTDSREAELHATLRAKMNETGFIISTYDIIIKSSSSQKSCSDVNYPDIDFLKNELRANDTLVWVKKNTYFSLDTGK